MTTPQEKIVKAKRAHRLGLLPLNGAPKGLPESPNAIEALEVAIDTLRYMGQSNIAEWCERGLPK